MTFLTILGVTEICSFRLVQEGKVGKKIPESSRLEFLGKFLASNYTLSDAEDNTCRCQIEEMSLREKCPNTEFFLVHIFPHSD